MSHDHDATITHAGAPPADPTATIASGTASAAAPPPATVPGYRLDRELGRGGMGVVYLATQDGLNRQVALKMVLSGEHASATEKGRFLAEAEAVAAVRHPGVVQVFDFGTHDGRPFFALEYLSGGSLAERLNGTPLPAAQAAKMVEAVARAVQAAHDVGVIHRDLKPANILFDADGTPKVTDFGLARKGDSQSGLTVTGAILGTPSYMAPEQAQGRKDVGPVADVYALGAVLYECLTGRPPFRAASPLETIQQALKDEPVPPSRFTPKLPRDLETICLKCLSKDPRKRYASAGAMADDLRRFRDGDSILAWPVSGVERGWRWVKKNPLLAVVALGGPLLLAGTTIIVLVAFLMTSMANVRLAAERVKAHNEQLEAERQRELARARLEQAIGAVDRMLTRVAGERWVGNPELQEERRQVLEEAVAFYQGLATDETDDPRVRYETAKAHARVATAYQAMGDLPKTEAAARAAVELFERLTEADPDQPDYPSEASESYSMLGNAAILRSDFTVGLQHYKSAVERARRASELRPDDPALLVRVVRASVGECFFYLHSEPARGRKMVADILALARRIGGATDDPFERRLELAYTLYLSASFDLAAGDFAGAGVNYAEADRVLTALAGTRPPSAALVVRYDSTRAVVTIQLGTVAANRARTEADFRRAVGLMEDGLSGLNALLRVHPRAFPYVSSKIPTLAALALLYRKLGEGEKADRTLTELDRLENDVLRDNPAMFWVGRLSRPTRVRELTERVSRKEFDRFEDDLKRMLDRGRQTKDEDTTYDVACVYAVASSKTADADRKEKWASRAVALLDGLVDAGYFRVPQRVTHLDEDADLVPLQKRDDFIAFLAAVKKSTAGPTKPK